ncbi:Heavy metal resistance transcriptional regulator HmrR [Sphingobium indicum BiD32]|uniref:Heavy metal resistance transcriptional regulator HmrR n=1 Tax=Sphingobium indicum BiD32 TaxID=1301087 RepID=N1MJ45_9SPHN|nr:Cu(I)-responsive transcriptional regulator [Sphingobium indicum]CCW16789.1 Heavy metal resistance transcriptional regulator HmrR [Sphingobium indicum BiD32]
MNIGQVAQATGVSQRMVRHYEKIGLIPAPPRRNGTFRDYAPDDLHRLRFIANARDLGFPIEEIRELLSLWADRNRSSADVKSLALARAAELHRKAEQLEQMRVTLLTLAEHCSGDARPDCPIINGIARNQE